MEPSLRRAVKKMSWGEVPDSSINPQTNQAACHPSQLLAFHIRFNIGDLEGATNDLKAFQMYNHFPANREITTKAGLCKNLWHNDCGYD